MPRRNVKHVRFANQNMFYPPPPVGVQPSTFSVATAPVFIRPDSNPSSSANPGHILLHRFLSKSAVTWNLIDSPSAITGCSGFIINRAIYEPATNPPGSSMIIISPYLPQTIKVHATNRLYITVEDVFQAVYRFLHTNITLSEFNGLTTDDDRWRAARAYQWRYRRHHSTRKYEEEKYGGIKHVDLLMGHTRFLGISKICCRSDTWQLNVTWQ